jgi:hypothetical protein
MDLRGSNQIKMDETGLKWIQSDLDGLKCIKMNIKVDPSR